LATSNPTSNTISLSWTASTDNVGVTGYDIYKDGVLYATVTGTTATVSG
jgi:chitodextrinase